jgi:Ni,Fe-hydrogenase III small subunit/ferredoxin
MFDSIKVRIKQGKQYIPDVKRAELGVKFRGFPRLDDEKCTRCDACAGGCPTGAVSIRPLKIDLGKCTFCGDCQRACRNQAIEFTNFHKMAAGTREKLIVSRNTDRNLYSLDAVKVRHEIKQLFGRSLKLRSVSAGGCNACELELNACSNVNFDMSRFGIEMVASPRHADGIVITGPVTENMAYALEDTLLAVPSPRIVIAMGTCAISGGVFQNSPEVNRKFFDKYPVDLYLPGCPVHPLTFINGILRFLGR